MPICDYEGWVDFKPDGEHSVSLHEYVEEEVIPYARVQILRCVSCGKLSWAWERIKPPIDVVYCKECKFGSTNKTVMTENPIMRCAIFRTMTEPNGFCYKGERREGETYETKPGVRIQIPCSSN